MLTSNYPPRVGRANQGKAFLLGRSCCDKWRVKSPFSSSPLPSDSFLRFSARWTDINPKALGKGPSALPGDIYFGIGWNTRMCSFGLYHQHHSLLNAALWITSGVWRHQSLQLPPFCQKLDVLTHQSNFFPLFLLWKFKAAQSSLDFMPTM